MRSATSSEAHRFIVEEIRARATTRAAACSPLLVGLCGAQGSGKSSMSPHLKRLLEEHNLRTVVLSLDDYYLCRAAREQLARSVHPLLVTRGVPGTHDTTLILSVLQALAQPGIVALPAFDKANDDCIEPEVWPRIAAPVDVIIFEGWCVGALPQDAESLSKPVNWLEECEDAQGIWRCYVNAALAADYQCIFRRIELLVLLAAPDFEVVYGWRLEQERELYRQVRQRSADPSRMLSAESLKRFVAHYERLTRHILAEMPQRAQLLIRLDAMRRPILLASSPRA